MLFLCMSVIARHRQAWPHLELKTRLRFHPVSLSLSMACTVKGKNKNIYKKSLSMVSVDMGNVVMQRVVKSRVMAPLKAIILKTLAVEK